MRSGELSAARPARHRAVAGRWALPGGFVSRTRTSPTRPSASSARRPASAGAAASRAAGDVRLARSRPARPRGRRGLPGLGARPGRPGGRLGRGGRGVASRSGPSSARARWPSTTTDPARRRRAGPRQARVHLAGRRIHPEPFTVNGCARCMPRSGASSRTRATSTARSPRPTASSTRPTRPRPAAAAGRPAHRRGPAQLHPPMLRG